MTTAHITRKAEPCDFPPGVDHETHRHQDGRLCVWEEGGWVTVNTVSEEVGATVTALGQKEIGLYGKYMVARVDRRDEPGGDKADARPFYFVLDPIFDPIARPAMATYALVAREHGYAKLADDIEHNLDQLAAMQAASMEEADPDAEARSLRVVATWTYAAHRAHYGDPATADRMAEVDMENLASRGCTLDDLMYDDTPPSARILPNA